MGYWLASALSVANDLATLKIQRHPIQVGLGYAWRISDRLFWGIALHLTADYASQRTENGVSELVAINSDAWLWSLTLNCRLPMNATAFPASWC